MLRFPRLRLRNPAEPESTPRRTDARCPRCATNAPAGYVVATAQGTVNLGWVTGEPGCRQWGDVLLDSRYWSKPARYPGYGCPTCGLVWFELSEPEADVTYG